MFKFFPDEGEVVESVDKNKKSVSSSSRPCIEIISTREHFELAAAQLFLITSTVPPLKYVKVPFESHAKDPKLKTILGSSSDLISGEYEGGFKLWECTFDLLSYIEDNFVISPDSTVLDLGCGHGLLGLYILTKFGSTSVVFQDYNEEVLNYLTIPNVITNFGNDAVLSRARFFGGSWSSMNQFIKEKQDKEFKFDLILSSETIYNTEYLEDFINLVDICLKPGGSLYLAAKTCYFGVGGGTKAFTSLINNKPNFGIDTVKVIQDGVHREVLHIYRKIESL